MSLWTHTFAPVIKHVLENTKTNIAGSETLMNRCGIQTRDDKANEALTKRMLGSIKTLKFHIASTRFKKSYKAISAARLDKPSGLDTLDSTGTQISFKSL